MIGAVNAILYPVAVNPEQALSRPLGRAAREREARALAREGVVFATEPVGPAFPSREAALEAYRERIEALNAEDRYCQLVERIVTEPGRLARLAPVSPTFENGRRWPAPPTEPPRTVWRLLISYWRPASAPTAEAPQARVARKAGSEVAPETLKAIARQPLKPVKPQQPLDIGLFETRLPEAPHIVVPDE
ncbi:hypothetical protein [Phenylobacterium soli]|uniref:Uncharacterized protein n=1 Tax=Phenylobacterium soli TaxID=2170551 RepID=A0A328AFC5_9CAUL|nr:hypothetical protein [Phenylobacterium soli]RAK53349.1 hypothetical protein DJ017_01800 [Phenylobacterium soli]